MSRALTYIVNNISLPYYASVSEAFSVAGAKLKKLGLNPTNLIFSVYRRSIDARRHDDIKFVYSISVSGDLPIIDEAKLSKFGVTVDMSTNPVFTFGDKRQENPVVIVGAGPAGMLSALVLAEHGFKVKLIERGGSISERKQQVEVFNKNRILDENTNIQFGAGGAGTFSDGKLVTRINDPLSSYILRRLVEFGAPEDILYIAKPHIGTDILSVVVDRILAKITELGGEVMYHTEMTGIIEQLGTVKAVKTSRGEIPTSAVILAIGHSARDTYRALMKTSLVFEAKSFSVGMRIEHLKEDIDRALYGKLAGDSRLPAGEYNLSYNTKARGVYTFCMCPGGEVVAATSQVGGVVSNGMSEHARDGLNSNSAVCCSIFKDDFGGDPQSAISFQENIEKRAFIAGGADYSAPIITVGDFIRGGHNAEPTIVQPTYMGGKGVKLARPESYLPEIVTSSIKNALLAFDKRIVGFANDSAVLTGAETRTSAPVRITRDPITKLAVGYTNLYPSGEGAGYAGGITSAAIDGIKCAMAYISRHKP